MRRIARVLMASLAILLSACAYTGGIGEPAARKVSYFSYAAGDDIKAKCTAGGPAQYRLIYNANWNEQVRAYDLRRSVIVGGGATLFTEVFGGGGNVSNFTLGDVSGPWRGKSATANLTEEQYLALVRAIEASGFGQEAPAGTRLESWEFYWLVAACADGRFHFNALRHPSDRFQAITFDKLLFNADATGVRVNPPRRLDSAEEYFRAAREKYYTFQLMVGRDGLAYRAPPL